MPVHSWTKPVIRIAAAGIGAAVGGPLGGAIGGWLGDVIGKSVTELVKKAEEDFGEGAAEKLFETAADLLLDNVKDSPANLESLYRESLRLSLNAINAHLDNSFNDDASWFANWNTCLMREGQLGLPLLQPGELVPANLDNLFRLTLERLDAQGNSINLGSPSINLKTRTLPKTLLTELNIRLPALLNETFAALIATPEYDQAWKQTSLKFENLTLEILRSLKDDTGQIKEGITQVLDRLLEIKAQLADQGKHLEVRPVVASSTPQPRIKNPAFRGSQFYFGSRISEFVGREESFKQLREFLTSDGTFQWWVLTGKAGSGKSRLALELGMHVQGIWQWGFLQDQPFDWGGWQPQKPTLLIADYAGSSAPTLGELIETLTYRRESLGQKVRILLLERSIEGSWWNKLLGVGSRLEAVLSSRHSLGTMELGKIPENSLWHIFAHYANLNVESAERESVVSLLSHLDPDGRPLFAALAGDAKARGCDIRNWDRTTLIRFHQREAEKRWNPQGVREIDKALFVFVTMVGGMNVDDLPSIDLKLYLPDAESFNPEAFEVMAGSRSDEYLLPLEPDILGEWFVLDFLRPGPLSKRKVRDFARALWKRDDHLSARGFLFVSRILDDFPDHPTLPFLVEPVPTNYSYFWEAAFHEYVMRRAETNVDHARRSFEESRSLYKGCLPNLSWLGRSEAAQKLCLCYLGTGNLPEGKKMYEEVRGFWLKCEPKSFFAEYVAICAWALSDYSKDHSDIHSALQHFEEMVSSLLQPVSPVTLNRLAPTCGLLSHQLIAVLIGSEAPTVNGEECAGRIRQQLGRLCRETTRPEMLTQDAELQIGWWVATGWIISEYAKRDELERASAECMRIVTGRDVEGIDASHATAKDAITCKCLAEIIDTVYGAIIIRNLSNPNNIQFRGEEIRLVEEADRLRRLASEILERTDPPIGSYTLWCSTLILSLHNMVRFLALRGQLEDAENARLLLANAARSLPEDSPELGRSTSEIRVVDALAFCIIGYSVSGDREKLVARTKEFMMMSAAPKIDCRISVFMALAVGTAPKVAKSESDRRAFVLLAQTLFGHFMTSGAVDALMAAMKCERDEALGKYRYLLLE